MFQELVKAAGHKYVRRVRITHKNGKKGYRYFYADDKKHKYGHLQGKGTGHQSEIKEGSAFRVRWEGHEGHFHVERVQGDRVTLRHDGAGKLHEMTTRELSLLIRKEHAEEIKLHQKRFRERLRREQKSGAISLSRTRKRGALLGLSVPEWEALDTHNRIIQTKDGAPLPYRLRLKNKDGHWVRKWVKSETAEALIRGGSETWEIAEEQERKKRVEIEELVFYGPEISRFQLHKNFHHDWEYPFEAPLQSIRPEDMDQDKLYSFFVRPKGGETWRRSDQEQDAENREIFFSRDLSGSELLAPPPDKAFEKVQTTSLFHRHIEMCDELGYEAVFVPHDVRVLTDSSATREEISLSADRPPAFHMMPFEILDLQVEEVHKEYRGKGYTFKNLSIGKRDPWLEETGFYQAFGAGAYAQRDRLSLLQRHQSGEWAPEDLVTGRGYYRSTFDERGQEKLERDRVHYTSMISRLSDWWASLNDSGREKYWTEYLDLETQPSAIRLRHPAHENAVFETPPTMQKFIDRGWKLHEFQRKAINFALSQPRVIWAMEMGLGKTLTALGLFSALREKPDGQNKMLVTAPISALGSWKKELSENTNLRFEIIGGKSAAKRRKAFAKFRAGELDVLVASPQSLAGKVDLPEYARSVDDSVLFVADEVHKFKTGTSQIGKGFEEISALAGRCVGMTGTPKPNKVSDLYNIVTRVAPGSLPEEDVFYRDYALTKDVQYRDSHGNTKTRAEVVCLRPEKLERLHEELTPHMFVRSTTDPDARIDLPERIDLTPRLEQDEKQQAIFDRLPAMTEAHIAARRAERYLAVVEMGAPGILEAQEALEYWQDCLDGKIGKNEHDRFWNQIAAEGAPAGEEALMIRLDQLLVDPAIFSETFKENFEDYETPKIQLVADAMIDHLETHPEAGGVLFSEWKGGMGAIIQALVKRGLDPAMIGQYHGTISPTKKMRAQEDINDGTIKVLIGQTKALETGANLQGRANFVGHLTTPWSPDTLVQSTARVYRQGQQRKTTILRPIGSDFDAMKNKIVSRKIALSSQITGASMQADKVLVERGQSEEVQEQDAVSILGSLGLDFSSLKGETEPEHKEQEKGKPKSAREKIQTLLSEGIPDKGTAKDKKKIQKGLDWLMDRALAGESDRLGSAKRLSNHAINRGGIVLDNNQEVISGDLFWIGVYAQAEVVKAAGR